MQQTQTAEQYWWALTDLERQRLERVIDHIIYVRLRGNIKSIFDLIWTARSLELDRDLLVDAILWVMQGKVLNDDD